MALRRGQGERARENAREPCPVCFDEDVTERAYFQCGHSVCSACNATLLQRGFLACPICRTPREGVSQAAVEHSNRERTRQNEADERGDGGMGIGLTVSHAGERYRILFFPDESEGSPFATLGRQDMSGWPAPGGRGARAMRPMRAARTLRLAPPYHMRRRSGRGQEEEEAGEVEEEEENRENRPPGVRMALDGPMEALVDGLLNPVNMQEFLARRQRV
jgi:hypothetical protein